MNSTWELQNLSKKYEINEGSLAISQWFRWDFASLARRLGHARPMAEDSPKTPSKANSLGSGLGEVSASRCKSFRSATEPSSTTLDKTFWQTVDSVYIYIYVPICTTFFWPISWPNFPTMCFLFTRKKIHGEIACPSIRSTASASLRTRTVLSMQSTAWHGPWSSENSQNLSLILLDWWENLENRFYHGFLTCFWPWRS